MDRSDDLAARIIPTLLLDDAKLVKGRQFSTSRVVGNPVASAKVFGLREVDELVILDVSARRKGKAPDLSTIARMAAVCFVPVTAGGGVDSAATARTLVRECGVDKVALGSGGWHLAEDIAAAIGRQSVTLVCSAGFPCATLLSAAGEVIVQSRERDGMMGGYDLERIREMAGLVDCPVVASSGCGSPADMDAALSAGADAVAAGAIWQFTSWTPVEVKEYLAQKGWPMRMV